MHNLSQPKKSSKNIINDLESSQKLFKEELNTQLTTQPPAPPSSPVDGSMDIRERVLALELKLQAAQEMIKKDFQNICLEINNMCEQLASRTDTNEDNIDLLNKNFQELVGQLNQLRDDVKPKIEEMKKELDTTTEKKKSIRDNFIFPLLVYIVLAVLGFLIGKYTTMSG